MLRKAKSKDLKSHLSDNFRPTQCLNHRRVYMVKNKKSYGQAGHQVMKNIILYVNIKFHFFTD